MRTAYAALRTLYARAQISKMAPSRHRRPLAAPPSRAESSLALRRRILESAFAQFRADGLSALSMRTVAADVGMSPMGLYRHFANRDALVNAMVDRALLEFEERLRSVSVGTKPLAYLRRLMRAYLEFAMRERATYELLFISTRPSDEPFLQDYKAGASPSFEILRDGVDRAMRVGALAERNSVDVALTIWAHVHGLVTLFLAGRYGGGEALFRKLSHRSLDVVFRGLGAREDCSSQQDSCTCTPGRDEFTNPIRGNT